MPGESLSGFVAGLTAGSNTLLGSLAVLGTLVVGAVLPFLPVVAAPAVAGWWVLRLRSACGAGSGLRGCSLTMTPAGALGAAAASCPP